MSDTAGVGLSVPLTAVTDDGDRPVIDVWPGDVPGETGEIAAELHIYAAGGHGFGLRPSDLPCSHWSKQYGAWLQSPGFLDAPVE